MTPPTNVVSAPVIGSTSLDVVRYLAAHCAPPNSSLRVGRYVPKPGIAQRLQDPAGAEPVWYRVWDEVLRRVETADDMEALVAKMAHHSTHPDETSTWEPAAALAAGALDRQAALLTRPGAAGPEEVLAFCSPVRTEDGRVGHQFPILDFRCTPGDRSLRFIAAAMRHLGFERGAILDSGRSYHFYGFRLLTTAEWQAFMYRCLLLEPYTDARYIGHRLLDGVAWLRLTETAAKPRRPVVVHLLGA